MPESVQPVSYTTRPEAPVPLALSASRSRPAPADRDLGRAVLDSPPVRGTIWLRWTGDDGIRTLHHGPGLARGWTERDVDGLDGWVALIEGRIVLGASPDGRPQPIVHAEAWQAGSTLHAALAQHPAISDHGQDEEEPDDQEHGLLGGRIGLVVRQGSGLRALLRSRIRGGGISSPRQARRAWGGTAVDSVPADGRRGGVPSGRGWVRLPGGWHSRTWSVICVTFVVSLPLGTPCRSQGVKELRETKGHPR